MAELETLKLVARSFDFCLPADRHGAFIVFFELRDLILELLAVVAFTPAACLSPLPLHAWAVVLIGPFVEPWLEPAIVDGFFQPVILSLVSFGRCQVLGPGLDEGLDVGEHFGVEGIARGVVR